MILKFKSPSPDISPDLQTYIFNCLFYISFWMPNRYRKLTVDTTETLTLQHQNIGTDLDLDSNTDTGTDVSKEVYIDKDISTYILSLLSLPNLFIKQIFIEQKCSRYLRYKTRRAYALVNVTNNYSVDLAENKDA